MHGFDFIEVTEQRVRDWFKDNPVFDFNGIVYTVSYYKELQHSKGTFAGGGDNQILFEVTYDGDKNETYFNVYNKMQSIDIEENN